VSLYAKDNNHRSSGMSVYQVNITNDLQISLPSITDRVHRCQTSHH